MILHPPLGGRRVGDNVPYPVMRLRFTMSCSLIQGMCGKVGLIGGRIFGFEETAATQTP